MNFGGDTNASTGFERTLYLLELPDTKEATLGEGLRVLGDYAGGLLLKTEEIEKERGIILSEKRTGDSVGYRTMLATYGFLLGGSLFPHRFPIGDASVIAEAGRERFVDFYDAWYRPELMSVVMVGDFDVAEVEKQIVATFTPLKARAGRSKRTPRALSTVTRATESPTSPSSSRGGSHDAYPARHRPATAGRDAGQPVPEASEFGNAQQARR